MGKESGKDANYRKEFGKDSGKDKQVGERTAQETAAAELEAALREILEGRDPAERTCWFSSARPSHAEAALGLPLGCCTMQPE